MFWELLDEVLPVVRNGDAHTVVLAFVEVLTVAQVTPPAVGLYGAIGQTIRRLALAAIRVSTLEHHLDIESN